MQWLIYNTLRGAKLKKNISHWSAMCVYLLSHPARRTSQTDLEASADDGC